MNETDSQRYYVYDIEEIAVLLYTKDEINDEDNSGSMTMAH